MKGFRVYKAALAALVVGSIVAACSGTHEDTTPQVVSGIGSRPERITHAWNLGSTQATATAVNLTSLQLNLNATQTQGTLTQNGAAPCQPSGQIISNLCPGVTYRSISYLPANPITLTMTAATLNATCAAPAGAPTPAPGFTAACYIVAYEGGVGPYVIQGPATANGSTLSIPAETTVLNFNGNTSYDFFLAYVTSESAVPPPPTATPSAPPTGPGAPTPTVAPTATACPTTSSWSWGDDARHRMDGGDDDGGSVTGCCSSSYSGDGSHESDARQRFTLRTPTPAPTATPTPTPAPTATPVASCSPCPSHEHSARTRTDDSGSCYGGKPTASPCRRSGKHDCR